MTHIEQLIQDMCPHGVEFKKLGEVTRTLPKGTLKTTDLTEEGFPVINSGKSLYGYYSEYNNDCQAVTIAARGEYAGWISYFNEKFWAGGLCYPYTSKDEKVLKTRFLYFWLKREEGIIMDTLVARGSIPALNKSDLDQLEIPIPPMAIQEKIVTILDEFSALAAELQAELQMRRKQYEYYRTQLLTPHSESNSADKSDDCNWVTKPLSEIAELKAGTHISAEHIFAEQDDEHPYPCFGGNGIRGYVANYSHEGEYPIIGRQGALCGCINYAQCKFYATEHAVVVKAKANNNPRYLFHMLTFADLNQYKSQGAQPGLAVGNLNVLDFSIPSIREQKRIADLLDKFEALTTSLSDGIPAEQAAQQKRYEYYRDLLLTFPRKAV